MRSLLALAVLAALCAAGPDKKKIRETLYAVLAEPRAKDRAKIIATLELEDPLEEVKKIVREGPLYPRDAQRARKKEDLVKEGRNLGGYAFEYDGRRFRYAVNLPSAYDPKKGHALLLDPGHGSWARKNVKEKFEAFGMFRRHLDAAGGRDWLLVRTEIVEEVGVGGRRGAVPEELANRIYQEMFRDLATRFHFDPDRIYATGLSQTGFWTWTLGVNRADRYAGLTPMSAISWYVDEFYAANLLNVPVYVLHGAKDPTCDVQQPRKTCLILARHGVRIRYREMRTGKHDYAVWGEQPGALRWLQTIPRDRYPKRVSKSLQTTHDGWCYWIRVDALEKPGRGTAGEKPTGGIDGEIDGQTIRLYSDGVTRITLGLASEMVNLDEPLAVVWNGKTVFEGKTTRSLATMLELVYDKTDWKQTFEAALELKAP
jgi:pimeloyl-ACP methyl ester carboxylesterase